MSPLEFEITRVDCTCNMVHVNRCKVDSMCLVSSVCYARFEKRGEKSIIDVAIMLPKLSSDLKWKKLQKSILVDAFL